MPSLDSMMLRQIIMDHYENPRNHGLVDDDNYQLVNMDSETCIDDIDVQALIEDGVIKDIRFDGEACAICTASTSIMSELLIGKTIDEANVIIENYNNMIYEKDYDPEILEEAIADGQESNRSSIKNRRKHMADIKNEIPDQEYAYGFNDGDVSVFKTPKGINEEIVTEISKIKNEPEWMLEYRLKSYRCFMEKPMPTWGVNLDRIDFDEYTYYVRPSDKQTNKWEEVPETIKQTFNKLGIPEAEQKYLSGVSTQYESEVVYHNMLKEVTEKGVIFLDIDSGLREYPEIFRKYFDTVIPYNDNKFSALNGAVWSGGSFIYVPPGVKLDKPLQSYFRINSEQMAQFERTLIIVDKGADIHYVEGCTAPSYSRDSLHAGVVEIIVGEGAKCRYTTIQNWSNNILNLVTQRAKVFKNGSMEWVDGNIGSAVTMKYPTCVLMEEGAKGSCITIAVAGENQIMDSGSKMIHLAPNTSSSIVSKSVSRRGGKVNYRGMVQHGAKAYNSKSKVECDTLILDDISTSDTVPVNWMRNNDSIIEHEATVSKISEEQLFYLMSRGLTKKEAMEMIVMGFIEPFARELPMEYAVELNQLIKLDFGDQGIG